MTVVTTEATVTAIGIETTQQCVIVVTIVNSDYVDSNNSSDNSEFHVCTYSEQNGNCSFHS